MEKLLEILACPTCKHKVLLQEGKIVCSHCQVAYPIHDGIPVMLREKAEAWLDQAQKP